MEWKTPDLERAVFVAEDAAVLGDVTAQEGSSIWFHATVRGDCGSIIIGEGNNVQDNCVLHSDTGYKVDIGKYVTIGHSAVIHGCSIGDGSLIGMGAIILNGAVIGKNCIVGAGALVTQNKVIPDHSLVIGSPAKVIRQVSDEEVRESRRNAERYIEHGGAYRAYFREHRH